MYKFVMAQEGTLRTRANRGRDIVTHTYRWAHPGPGSVGIEARWDDPGCWLSQDFATILQLFGGEGAGLNTAMYLAGEIEELLDSAAFGDLESKAVTRCKSRPGVAEIRLLSSFPIGEATFHVRIYYGEPEEWEGLVSLCLAVKSAGPRWKEEQNASIALAQERGEAWIQLLE
ncbi:hypothetical protein ACRQFN_07070 [Actinotignum sp. GS-2025e]|uniref:hypothetical protein n=2 Tax=Actinotignum TaxID=1653174 RepID=UPI00254FF061|nr:hypothetical protein [Actinotignum timonense]